MADQNGVDRKLLRQQVKAFKACRPDYVLYAEFLETVLDAVREQLLPMALVSTRTKEVASFAGKVARRWPDVKDGVKEFTDLAGGRIIVQLLSDIQILENWLRTHFTIHSLEDLRERLKPDQFGYRSVHLIVSVDPNKLPREMVHRSLRDNRSTTGKAAPPKFKSKVLLKPKVYARIKGLKAEIQIRTIAQHAWSDVGHDLIYKGAFAVPADHQRQNAKIAALIEDIDEGFMALVNGIRILETNVGAYKPPQETLRLIDCLQATREFDPMNANLALELAKLQISLAGYDDAIGTITSFQGEPTAAMQNCLAQAMFLKHRSNPHGREFVKTQEMLERILAADVNALDESTCLEMETVLAESYTTQGKHGKAFEHFAKAFATEPADPRALGGYLREQIAEHPNPEYAVELLRPSIETAIQRCRAQIAARVNLPFALFHLAEFEMLLKPANSKDLSHAYFGLYALCRAVSVTMKSARYAKATGIRHAILQLMLDRFDRLHHIEETFYWITWAKRTLMLALSLPVEGITVRLHEGLKKVSKPLEIHDQPPGLASRCRVLLVAGGCDRDALEKMREYSEVLAGLLDVYEGTVMCGGTREGISGVVGELCHRRRSNIVAIGYLPNTLPTDGSATPAPKHYLIRRTDGEQASFSALEPIQSWIDLLASGVHPSQVKLIGINGGKIAGFEYHLAAMLGAGVGILRESGRQADELMLAAVEPGNEDIHFLPNDTETLRALLTYPPQETFNKDQLLSLSAGIKREYETQNRINEEAQRRKELQKDPKLIESFDISNRMQARHIIEKLARLGKKIEPLTGKPAPFEFTPREIELLAEMEHGRWVIERTWDGWTLGKRDDAKRQRPQLVAWSELPQDEREKDLNAVKAIPKLLEGIGYEIVDDNGSQRRRKRARKTGVERKKA